MEFNCQYMYIAKYVSRVSLRQFVQRKSAANFNELRGEYFAKIRRSKRTSMYVEPLVFFSFLRRRGEFRSA